VSDVSDVSDVILGRLAHDAIIAHARDAAPAECCGLLIGPRGSRGAGSAIVEAVRTRNLAANPGRFQIDPEDHINARRTARHRGLDVLGFYHSHPRSGATPSATDLAEASYPGHLYLIVSVLAEPADVRLYQFEAGAFREVVWRSEIADARANVDHDGR
jgi:proteasome lid subunit RPN8/RPN11